MCDCIGIVDLLYCHRVGIIQTQYVQDERQGILSVRDKRIRQNGMSVAAAAAYPGDPEPVVYWLSVLNLHHATLIVGKDPALTFCTAVGTTFQSRIETPHVVFIVLRDGNIQKKELAIDQVLPYHNSALEAMLSLEIRALTLCEAWRCIEEGLNLCRDGAFLFFIVCMENYNGVIWIRQEKSAPRHAAHSDRQECLYKILICRNPAVTKKFNLLRYTFICLGDVGSSDYAAQIKAGHKVLLLGNHDRRKDYKDIFDEIYEGPLFISEKILLSHEPVYGLPWCLNIHGHDHNGIEPYAEGCKHLNLAANVCGYTPVSLGLLIKGGILADISSIHRQTIDRAAERKQMKEQFYRGIEMLSED